MVELNPREVDVLSEIISETHKIRNKLALELLIENSLKSLIEYESTAYGIYDLSARQTLCGVNYITPTTLGDGVLSLKYFRQDSLAASMEYMITPRVISCTINPAETEDNTWFSEFDKSGIDNIAIYTQSEFNDNCVSIFAFTNTDIKYRIRTMDIIKLFVPHFRVIMSQVYRYDSSFRCNKNTLSPREVEVLGWVSKGKTNEEISIILSISIWTVKNHVANIISKLNVTNRAQALFKATSLQLMDVKC